ncbi:MAG: FG-GAP-like repeat-containing protein [Ginsengibacter sp.]
MKNIALIFFYSLLAQISFSQPTVSSITPKSGSAGTSVVITGANFSTIAANNTVFFGPVKATVLSASASALTVVAPAGATIQPLTVTVNGLTGYSPYGFILTFPGGGEMNQGSFANKIDFTTDLHPNDIALADLDGDGKSDVVTANNYSTAGSPASISILRNTSTAGSVTFAAKQDINNGVATYAVAAGDLDGDGKQDLVASSIGDQNISVFRNTSAAGVISFAPKIDFTGANSPYDIAIGDVDGDGKPDIAVVNATGNTVSLYRNTGTTGTISFAPKVDFNTPLFPQHLVLVDFDGDGKYDIAVTNKFSYSFSIFRNTSSPGNISFAPRVDQTCGSGNEPTGITVGDMNNDNKPDLMIVISKNSSGDAGFGQSFKNTSTVGSIGFVNLNGVSVGKNGTAYHVAAGDINGDGKPDLALASTGNYETYIFQNDITPSFWTFGGSVGQLYSLLPYAIVLGDLNGDSKPEIITTDFTWDKVSVFKNNCGLPYIASFSPDSGTAGTSVSISGGNFMGATSVTFGGIPASSFTIINSTTINAIVNNGASGNVIVTTPQGTDTLAGFSYYGPPVITSFTPVNAGTGQTISITGSFTGTLSAVSFGGVPAISFTMTSPTMITAVVGSGATGDVLVTTSYGSVVKPGFKFFVPPVVSAFSPASGFTGTVVNITGSNFTGTTVVRFGSVNAQSFTIISSTKITAVVGEGATGSVYVTTTPGGTDSMNLFQFDPPVITSFMPSSAPAGTIVTIYGNNFSATAANNIVYFGAARAIITAATNGVLTVKVPTGTTNYPITVTTHGATAYSQKSFIMTFAGGSSSFTPVSFNWKGGFETGIAPHRIISADLDGDGKVDCIAPGGLDGSIVALRNTSTINNISFATAVDITENHYSFLEFATADFNSDGKLDMVMTSYGLLRIFLNTSTPGSITFAPYINLPLVNFNPRGILIGDFDGDSKPDVGVFDFEYFNNNNAFCIFRNTGINGNISFARTVINYYSVNVTTNAFAADFNQDNKIDLIISSGDSQISTDIIPNRSTPGNIDFGAPLPVNAANEKIIGVSDLNSDNLPDLILSNSSDDKIFSLVRNTSTAGNFTFTDKVSFNTGLSINTIVPGELSGDNRPDIVVNNYFAKSVAVYKNNSAANGLSLEPNVRFFSQLTSDQPDHATIVDIDGDGKTDIVVAHSSDNKISVFRNEVKVTTKIQLCPPIANTTIPSGLAASNYQWKLNTGNGFVNITDNSNYTGTNTGTLQLTDIPSSFYAYQFICVANKINSDVFSLEFANTWNGSINHDWDNPANWSCGTIPDSNTDVIINSGVVKVNSNTTVRSLTLNPGVSLTMATNITLTILH